MMPFAKLAQLPDPNCRRRLAAFPPEKRSWPMPGERLARCAVEHPLAAKYFCKKIFGGTYF
jgi:hypothetical protein